MTKSHSDGRPSLEDAALATVALQAETQRVANGWPHIIRSALWPGLDKVIVAVATVSHPPAAVSMDWDTAEKFIGNLQKCLAAGRSGEHTRRGGNPPLTPQKDN